MAERDQANASLAPALVLSIGMLALLGWVLWGKHHGAIAYFMMKVSYYEAIPSAFLTQSNAFLQEIAAIAADPWNIPFKEAYFVMYRAGFPYSLLVLALSVYIGLSVKKGAYAKAIRRLDADTLVEATSHSFSAVAPVVGKDITKDDSPRWAVSMRPEEYAKKFNLIVADKLDTRAALSRLRADLGSPIETPDKMSDPWKVLFAVFSEMAAGDKAEARRVIDALNYSAMNSACRPDYSAANALYQKHKNGDLYKREVIYHRYPGTLIMRLLEMAREECGVLPASEFLWVKPNDRALWYVINTTGRKVSFVESAAVFAQYKAEKVARASGMALKQPCVEEAVDALERDLFKTGTVASLSQSTWS